MALTSFPYVENYEPHTYTFDLPCFICKEVTKVTVPAEGLWAYNHGSSVQDAFPELSANIREMIISCTCPKCWNDIFPPEAEE